MPSDDPRPRYVDTAVRSLKTQAYVKGLEARARDLEQLLRVVAPQMLSPTSDESDHLEDQLDSMTTVLGSTFGMSCIASVMPVIDQVRVIVHGRLTS